MNEVVITILYDDYEILLNNKTIYEVEIISYLGLIKTKKIINVYKYILIFVLSSFLIIYLLSNLIFRVDIITNDKRIKDKLNKYLITKGISKYHLKKNYNELKNIKEDILTKYKDEIDWIEIESIGSKYIIRYEPRVNTKFNSDSRFQSIIASKNAVIYSMDIKRGQIIKNRFDYVKKGDVIVSGYIYLNDKIMDTIKAEGIVYGETWYKVSVKYPLKYESIKETGKNKKVLTIKFINSDINIFNFNKYKYYDKKSNILLKNNILPISINIEKQSELSIKRESNNEKEAVKKAVNKAVTKINKKLNDKEYIKDYKILNTSKTNKEVSVSVFVSVIEKISDYSEIEEYVEVEDTSEQP